MNLFEAIFDFAVYVLLSFVLLKGVVAVLRIIPV